jgi:subtilisin family serine protease
LHAAGVSGPSAQSVKTVMPVPENVEYKSDEMLICFDKTLPDHASRARVLKTICGATLKHEFKLVPGLVVVKLPPGLTVSGAWARFNAEKGIRFFQPNYIYRAQSVPNDLYFSYQWNLNNTGQIAGAIADIDIRALKAWSRTRGSTNIIVAVIDTGIRYTHEDLVANMWTNPGEIPNNGIDDDNDGYVDDVYGIDVVHNTGDPFDIDGHGTSCAGIIGAAGNNGKGIAGVCWDVKLMALKFMEGSSGNTEGAVRCIEYAVAKGAKILNNSWGTSAGSFDPGIKASIDAAGQAGVLCIFSAGNEYGINNDEYPVYPANYDSTNIISVMSFDERGERAAHSNYGATSVDIAAPGTNILTCTSTGNYGWRVGTSVAAAHVSGACALIYSLNPQLDWRQVKQIILDTADKSDALSGQCVSGGRLNLARAVSRVIPESWLLEYRLATDGSADNADADSDGMSNWNEWFAGTNPTNAYSLLRFEGQTTQLTNGNFRVRWQSVPGKMYWLESSEFLQSPLSFTPFVSNVLSTASYTEYLDVRPATTSRFYRVGVQAE